MYAGSWTRIALVGVNAGICALAFLAISLAAGSATMWGLPLIPSRSGVALAVFGEMAFDALPLLRSLRYLALLLLATSCLGFLSRWLDHPALRWVLAAANAGALAYALWMFPDSVHGRVSWVVTVIQVVLGCNVLLSLGLGLKAGPDTIRGLGGLLTAGVLAVGAGLLIRYAAKSGLDAQSLAGTAGAVAVYGLALFVAVRAVMRTKGSPWLAVLGLAAASGGAFVLSPPCASPLAAATFIMAGIATRH